MDKYEHNEIRNKVLRGFRRAIKKLIKEKIQKNEKMIISRNGKIEEVNPNEI
ncbi:MAG: hypothetical protein V1779_16790 [bacterium]